MTQQRTRIKFCGLTRAEDAQLAAELGVDFAGFIGVPGSPRHLSAEAAAAIAALLPASIKTLALFQNAEPEAIEERLRQFRPALMQFHGRESPAFCARFGLPWIKAVPMGEPQVYARWEQDFSQATALLADSHTAAGGGGTGHRFEWDQLPVAAQRRLPLMLAGGLTPETVGEAIRRVRPWGVDVSSGIEGATKGMKDHRKMRAFVEAVRAADEA
ncbi:MAG: phosphoribosylanthranilate isomerase [Pseudomonadota bacterium]